MCWKLNSLHFCQTTNRQLLISLLPKNVGKNTPTLTCTHVCMLADDFTSKELNTPRVQKMRLKFVLNFLILWRQRNDGKHVVSEKRPGTNKDRDMTEAVSRPSCSTHGGSEINGERFYARLSDTIEKTFSFFPTTKGVCMDEIEMSGCIVFNFHRGKGASHTFSGLLILPQRSRQFIATPFPPFGNYTAGYIHVILPQRPLG